MNGNYSQINKKSPGKGMEETDFNKEEAEEDGLHILHLCAVAKNLYINDGIELSAISEMFKKHITLEKIVEVKEAQKWDEERNKLLKIKNTLYGNAKQLVKMTLAMAKIDPTANNITAYKRAIESLIVLKKTMPVKKTGKDDIKINPEHIAEFADAAGLDYTHDSSTASALEQNNDINLDDSLKSGEVE